jgi:hypothetical protein
VSALPARLRTALAARGLTVVTAAPLPGHGHAATFVLDLADGRRVKLRQYRRGTDAARVDRCLGAEATGMLPRPVARVGRWLAVEYVEGETLDRLLKVQGAGSRVQGPKGARRARRRLIRAAGAMLARLHAVPPPPVTPTSSGLYPRVVTLVVNRLARQERLTPAAARRLLALERPAAPRHGLTHGDACPENLVRTRAGRLRAIDEERVAVRPIAYDVARAICRWRLGADEERVWLAGYTAAGGDAGEFLRDRPFWIAAALATSAAYRMKYRPGALGPIVRALKILASAISLTTTKVTKGNKKVSKR